MAVSLEKEISLDKSKVEINKISYSKDKGSEIKNTVTWFHIGLEKVIFQMLDQCPTGTMHDTLRNTRRP